MCNITLELLFSDKREHKVVSVNTETQTQTHKIGYNRLMLQEHIIEEVSKLM